MITKKITLNELRILVKQIIKEESLDITTTPKIPTTPKDNSNSIPIEKVNDNVLIFQANTNVVLRTTGKVINDMYEVIYVDTPNEMGKKKMLKKGTKVEVAASLFQNDDRKGSNRFRS